MLNLEETHSVMCLKKHKLTREHDPKTDVIFTKCMFDYELRKLQVYENVIKHF